MKRLIVSSIILSFLSVGAANALPANGTPCVYQTRYGSVPGIYTNGYCHLNTR